MKAFLTLILTVSLAVSSAWGDSAIDTAELEAMIADGQAKPLAEQMEARLKEGDDPLAYYWLGRAELALIDDASAFRKLGLARSAKNNLEEAVAMDPDFVPARVSLARYYLEAPAIAGGSEEAAQEQADKLMDLDAASAYGIKATLAALQGEYDESINWERKALAADEWGWDEQYMLIISAVHRQVDSATEILNEAVENVQRHADDPDALLPLIAYQRGKLAAVTGTYLESGQTALEQYLLHTPPEGEPGLDWAQFRLSQVERQLGLSEEAIASLEDLESREVSEDLSFALRDERRWHYSD